MSGLPREILKWIQSLDLSYSVKNVKRDFANGFLVAEIFSRYYKADVQMHSYDNGSSIDRRENNWMLLQKFFKKREFEFSKEEIDAVIHCQDGAVPPLLIKIFTLLTKKTVAAPMKKDDDNIPPFARPTTNSLISNRLNHADVKTTTDQGYAPSVAEEVVNQQNAQLKEDRVNEPDRFDVTAARQNKPTYQSRVATRKVDKAGYEAPTVTFASVQVKAMDDESAKKVRYSQQQAYQQAKQEAQAQAQEQKEQANSSSQNMNESWNPADTNNTSMTGGGGGGVVKPSFDLLNSCVVRCMEGTESQSLFDPRKPAVICFANEIARIPDELSAKTCDTIRAKLSSMVAENCLASPKEFWNFFYIMWTAVLNLKSNTEGKAFASVICVLESVGREMVSKDQYIPFALFHDFALQKLVDGLISYPEKITQLAPLLYAFCMQDVEEHAKVIKIFKDKIPDLNIFLSTLKVLLTLEQTFSNVLLDLYLYYIDEGLRNASPSARASAVGMLTILAGESSGQGHRQAVNLVDTIKELASDVPVVQAEVVGCLCAILSKTNPTDEASKTLLALVETLISTSSPPIVRRAGTLALSSLLTIHSSTQAMFTESCFGDNGNGSDAFALSNIPALRPPTVNSALIAKLATEDVATRKLENVQLSHVRALAYALRSKGKNAIFAETEVVDWIDLYNSLRDHLLVEVSDPQACEDVLLILDFLLRDKGTRNTATDILVPDSEGGVAPFYGVLGLVFPKGEEKCQKAITEFLQRLLEREEGSESVYGNEVTELANKLLILFSNLEAEKFVGTALELLLSEN